MFCRTFRGFSLFFFLPFVDVVVQTKIISKTESELSPSSFLSHLDDRLETGDRGMVETDSSCCQASHYCRLVTRRSQDVMNTLCRDEAC